MRNMSEMLARAAVGLYGLSLVASQMIVSNGVNYVSKAIEFPMMIMNLGMKVFHEYFPPVLRYVEFIDLPKPYRLNRETRPPNLQMA